MISRHLVFNLLLNSLICLSNSDMALWFSFILKSMICLLLCSHFLMVLIFFLVSMILLFKSLSIFLMSESICSTNVSFLTMDYILSASSFFIFSISNSGFMSNVSNSFLLFSNYCLVVLILSYC